MPFTTLCLIQSNKLYIDFKLKANTTFYTLRELEGMCKVDGSIKKTLDYLLIAAAYFWRAVLCYYMNEIPTQNLRKPFIISNYSIFEENYKFCWDVGRYK